MAALLLAGVMAAAPAAAANLSYHGALTADDGVAEIAFLVPAPATVTIRTLSYAGGTQADGRVVAAGGFDPMLALFDGTGLLLNFVDDGRGVADPVTRNFFDAELELTLEAGAYLLTVLQYDNFTKGPHRSDGFQKAGQPTFTVRFNCGAPMFCDIRGNARNGEWAVDILNVAPAAAVVPVPAALPLFVSGLAGVMVLLRRRR